MNDVNITPESAPKKVGVNRRSFLKMVLGSLIASFPVAAQLIKPFSVLASEPCTHTVCTFGPWWGFCAGGTAYLARNVTCRDAMTNEFCFAYIESYAWGCC